ncbi:50S ribosomal protein L1 [Spiroplasma platyhelix]|uniref:Large ribosomal subunit protein uL1 n=1 Tax=Spiroplasma platyhelix PALS-1 TaxID=1276218 RepID=A0A846U1V3_9MOLU|nr:50S ribosomal protein L1 [Spiroplasma platyhelix]MBE4704119.1 50S ribosomal protein L1 [Spiroplasma platyhelix PALS-1]NKE38489.1 50S ribosomal protein L1 [Spiroplasma platyhelix PALS-1]UJB29377.1 50S ribosomal protein L1 [Spiroplasma platyhelix PALS-1]
MIKKSKRFQELAKLVDRTTVYSLEQAISLAKQTSTLKFDATVEAVFRLNLDPKKAEQMLRGSIVLPEGTGKTQKVLVLTTTKEKEAIAAGADLVGDKEMITKIQGGFLDFDIIVATPEIMSELGKIGKILGPKGLMPTAKLGTVTTDVAKAINDIRKGKIEYRVDKNGNIHVILGKVSFSENQLKANYQTILNTLRKAKPATVKGAYIKNISISTTMGPGIKVTIED